MMTAGSTGNGQLGQLPQIVQLSSDQNHTLASPPAAINSANNKTGDVFRPVVFQCKQCRAIVADSADLVSMDPQQRLVSFRRPTHPNITIKPEWHLKQDGVAFGSVFQNLACKNCGVDMGCRYHTTNADTDHLRGLLTLKTECLIMYELHFDNDKVKRDIEETIGSGLLGPTSSSSPSTANFDVEITKLQKFCLVLYDRVVRLEEQVIALSAAKPEQ